MADVLKKELCLLSVWKDKDQKLVNQEKIIGITKKLKTTLPNLQISSLLLQGSLRAQIINLVDHYNAVLIVIHQTEVKQGLRALRESSVPFLFVNGSMPEFLQYKNILVPVDFRKASKETSLWASYFGRFNKSLIHVISAHETNTDQKDLTIRNVEFFKKFLSSLYVRFTILGGKSTSWGIWNETLTNAENWNGDAMILSGSSSISFLDLLIGLPEKRLIRQAGDLPVLLINPRKDICVLCD
jgi:nucleotide-binding universal stress UspA family protein